jgi:hypothetical protein
LLHHFIVSASRAANERLETLQRRRHSVRRALTALTWHVARPG